MRKQIERMSGVLRSVKGRTAVAATVLLLGSTLVPQAAVSAGEQEKKHSKETRPAFYLTQERVEGDQALAACAAGYHMASMWEILDPSNLRYDTALGVMDEDAGFGPPVSRFGWVRTGNNASTLEVEGVGNCNAWTSNAADHRGTAVLLRGIWRPETSVSAISPWSAAAGGCSAQLPVWCVQE
jgi:hypothetical protein